MGVERESRWQPATPSTPDEIEWVPVRDHPVFTSAESSTTRKQPCNLAVWDESSSRLYIWDPDELCVNRLSLRFGDSSPHEPSSLLAASPAKTLYTDTQLQFEVSHVAVNRAGTSLALAGLGGLSVVHLQKQVSRTKDGSIMCRTVSVGSRLYLDDGNLVQILQVSWHPHSDTHLGVLYSDSIFRIFDLSSDTEKAEQEFYLQPINNGRRRNASSICPVAFSFGGEHFWDRFSVFFVFSDGSVYVLCPVVPFGSFYNSASIEEIYKDVHTFGLQSSNPKAVNNSKLPVSWLEATFPQIVGASTNEGTSLALKAHPYVLPNSSLLLQGPLVRVSQTEDQDSNVQDLECKGRAVGFLYCSINKDSILVIAWSGGQLQIDALADEVQPLWSIGSTPCLRFDSAGLLVGAAMICESVSQESFMTKVDLGVNSLDTVWLGHPPLLLRISVVDMALPTYAIGGNECQLCLFSDPLVPERIYCLNSCGLDLIYLHFLPFTYQTSGKDEHAKPPSVRPILSTCQSDTYSEWPLQGFVALADSFGNSWILGLTSSHECVVVEMKAWDVNLMLDIYGDGKASDKSEQSDVRTAGILSKELVIGPKPVLLPQGTSGLRSMNPDSIEGRSTLHHFFKLFHENYVEYSHKVFIELKHHGDHLKKIIAEQHKRLRDAEQMILKVEEKQPNLNARLKRAVQACTRLEERLQSFKSLPGAYRKPLTQAELEFKFQLDQYKDVELGALRSSIGTVNARLRRYSQYSQSNIPNPRQVQGRSHHRFSVLENQISQLKSSISKLSLVNSENSEKVGLVESALQSREAGN